MKFNIKICLLAFFASILFVACNKENIDVIEPTEDPSFTPQEIEFNNLVFNLKTGDSENLALRCVDIQLPFDLIIEDGSKISIFTYDEYKAAVEAEAPNRVTDFDFPITGTDQNGEAAVFDDNSQLGVSFASCVPDNGWTASTRNNATIPSFLLDGYCFSLVYPVDLEDEDGNSYTAENEDEFIDYCATIDPLFFSLPLTVTDVDGNELDIESVDAFFELLIECEGISPPAVGNGVQLIGFGCNTLVYPFNLILEDSTSVAVNNEDEYVALLMTGQVSEIEYPFSLTNLEGETIVINNFEDIIVALAECGIIIEITEGNACDLVSAHILLFFNQGFGVTGCGYEINFPVQVNADGTLTDLENMEDYFDVFNNNTEIDLIYPINTSTQDGSALIFESDEEICEFIEDCE